MKNRGFIRIIMMAVIMILFVRKAEGLEVLYNGYGPRPLALGGAYIAVGGDPEAVFWNPGGIPTVKSAVISTGYQKKIGDFDFIETYAAFNVPKSILPFGGTIGLGFVYWGTEEEKWSELNELLGTMRASEFIGAIAYKKEFAGILSLGVAMKYAQSDIDGIGDKAFVLDVGGMASIEGVGIGLMVRNIGFGSSTIPIGMSLGAYYTFFESKNNQHSLAGAVELDSVQGTGFTLRFGSEYTWWYTWDGNIQVRLGYDTTPSPGLGFSSGISMGLGFTYFGISIDYTALAYGLLGFNHEVTLSYNIDNAVLRKSIKMDDTAPEVDVSLPGSSVIVVGEDDYSEIEIAYEIDDNVGIDNVTVSIQDSTGREVVSEKIPGLRGLEEFEHSFVWDGKDEFGEPVLDEVYTVVVSSEDLNYNEGTMERKGLVVSSDPYGVIVGAEPEKVTILGDVFKFDLLREVDMGMSQWRLTIKNDAGEEVIRFSDSQETTIDEETGVSVSEPVYYETVIWDVTDSDGNMVDNGTYEVHMQVEYENGIKRSSFPISVEVAYE